MSRRHRDPARDGTPRKGERLAEHRRARRAARQKIAVVEPDSAVLPGEVRGPLHAHRPTVREQQRPRHWKLPFWKRRRALWTERALAERRLADPIPVGLPRGAARRLLELAVAVAAGVALGLALGS